jgi:hypothetical protein
VHTTSLTFSSMLYIISFPIQNYNIMHHCNVGSDGTSDPANGHDALCDHSEYVGAGGGFMVTSVDTSWSHHVHIGALCFLQPRSDTTNATPNRPSSQPPQVKALDHWKGHYAAAHTRERSLSPHAKLGHTVMLTCTPHTHTHTTCA